MSTLFQLHANMSTLKAITKDMAGLWHAGDSVLLLGETVAYLDWFAAYVDDINADDEVDNRIVSIHTVYLLTDDINALNDSATLNLDFTAVKPFAVKLLSDTDWVELTQKMTRVVTLASTT